MALYTQDSRERVRDAIDFVELVSARSDLRRAGPARFEGLCPFHDERTPSFGIDPTRKVYHCFGCGAGGDVFQFVQETEGVDFKGALELLADRCGVELEREQEDPQQAERRAQRERLLALLARTSAYYERCLWDSAEGQRAREQLAERDLAQEILREFHVGYAPSAWNRVLDASRRAGFSEQQLYAVGLAQRSRENGRPYDRFRSRIMFPLSDVRGRVLGFGARAVGEDQKPKYVNTADNDIYHKGRHLYGAHLARAHAARVGQVILCEGYTDVIALHQAGIRNAVGLMGTALTDEQLSELARMASTVLLALDADSAGQEAMLRAATLATRRNLQLRVVTLPAGADPAEVVQRGGAGAIERAVEQAVPFERFRVDRVLAGGDRSSPEGKDRMLAQLRPVFAPLAPSALRMELMQLVSGTLALPESLVETVLADGRGSGTADAPRRAGPTRVGGGDALARGEETERAFLALCIASPQEGEGELVKVDVPTYFTSELLRRAARHLRERLDDPMGDAQRLDADPELKALLAELVVQAGREHANPVMIQVQRLQLELAQIEREIQAARLPIGVAPSERGSAGGGSERPAIDSSTASGHAQAGTEAPEPSVRTRQAISEMATRKADVQREFDRLYSLVLDETGSGSD
jgi:DNA primase